VSPVVAIEMPEERIDLLDPALEGKSARIGFEEGYRFGPLWWGGGSRGTVEV
jgi:hypothetical protein